ncbi:calcineurin-like phosphoesterase C-terminal domain-containing protein [Sinomicrobium weinanense]|uniref:Calcineurin-like phosphoesterase C-terminal domain-containing protein n=1 Tax=Sinomicrobium weinanense TaxID=2842200 RepID=A0A926JT81_9FLAO|nr:calcineurin-like phosphoesterase family protein [Sinomicrobium weinanense]MBC9796833.1 calcineurin-like phosphoesterase C-terminal domain-containing protein [Sinomicrobium weinanense]MBU3125206.1 calcineurin-like phosphoesterase family protein [Sinomicrobium weinanense]
MTQTRRKFIKIGGLTTLAGLSGIGLGFSGCKDDDSFDPDNGLNISKVIIPSSLDILAGGEVTLHGKGFQAGDQITLTSSADENTAYTVIVSSVTEDTMTFPVPEGVATGNYKITLTREATTLLLGSTLVNLMADTDLPDIEGMTVKGVVYSNGEGIPGVTVSDGYEVTVTDDQGRYYLPSLKKTGFVFISVPGNFEVVNNGNAPQFFKRLSSSADTTEQKNFSLIETNNEKHVVITMADWHLANRNNDLDQYNDRILPDVNTSIDKYAAEGNKVYVLTLGDMTWDLFWYDNNFGLSDYIPYMNKLNCPVFNLIGNHDNDPYHANDWDAENQYRTVIGPTYYSFNLGKIHYVVLDDVEYLNSGGGEGNVGQRNYNEKIVSDQLEWLKKDLAAITDKSTPVVVAMHTPLYKRPSLDAGGNQVNQLDLMNGSELIDCLKDFSTVHVLSGHVHVNYTVEEEPSIMEHNTAAVCATWWWTGRSGYAGNHICKDGSPGGYGIWKMNGSDMQWSYKSAGYPEDYQFRAYDLNEIHITAADFAPNATDADLAPYVGPYGTPGSKNEVLINIWGYDSQWDIEVTENGNKLDVTRLKTLDPLHIVSYEAFRVNDGKTPTSAFKTTETTHMFKVTAASADSTLNIKVTDRFGNVNTESMERPKAFSLNMS